MVECAFSVLFYRLTLEVVLFMTFSEALFMNLPDVELQDAVKGFEEFIGDVLNGKWDHERTKFSLPPLMDLVSTWTTTLFLTYTFKFMSTDRHGYAIWLRSCDDKKPFPVPNIFC